MLQQGPWFINGFFLTVKRWNPNFVASESKEKKSSILIRLPEIPTIKTDVCTLKALRGHYASICLEVPIGVSIKIHIRIGHHNQSLVYEGSNILCYTCGVLGPQISHV